MTKNRAKVLQKNGDIYIYEREYQYDSEIRKTKRILNKLVAKIPKGMNEEVITRPKQKSTVLPPGGIQMGDIVESNLSVSRQHTGLTDLLNHVGNVSGIDDALLASTDKGTALKIMSIARFFVATSGVPELFSQKIIHYIFYLLHPQILKCRLVLF